MTPPPDWEALGQHNWEMVSRIRAKKKAEKEARENKLIALGSLICSILGLCLYFLK